MTFYGKLFHLGSNEIEKRTDELLEFLQLPNKFRILASLRWVIKIYEDKWHEVYDY